MTDKINRTLQIVFELFADSLKLSEVTDAGMGHSLLSADGAVMQDYQLCINAFRAQGFESCANNGAHGLKDCVYTESLTGEDLTVTITLLAHLSKLYVTAACGQPLSAHLQPHAACFMDDSGDARTRLHMLELFENGNSFLIQLKNGHFIMNDGGLPADLPYFLDYLESLVPAGEKPVIDAWMFSHAHANHIGLLEGFVISPEQANRISVQGVYLNHPSSTIVECAYAAVEEQWLHAGLRILKNADGTHPPVYRLQTGQRYYFCDIRVDVIHTQEQLSLEEYARSDCPDGFNETSVWLMYTIDWQNLLLTGDADSGSIRKVMEVYPQEFWRMTMYAVPNHGLNVDSAFTRICQADTILYTGWWGRADLPLRPDNWKQDENRMLQNKAREFMSWGDGTKIFTFPYKPGQVQCLPAQQWLYHPGYINTVRRKRCLRLD